MIDESENKDTNIDGSEVKKKVNYLPTKFSLTIRLMVAAYLAYIVYSLKDVQEKYTGNELIFFIIAIAAFGVIAFFLLIHSIRALITGRYVGGAMDESTEDETSD